MKKVIQINYQNAVFTIEEAAYELLKNYIESLKDYFKKEESADEIMHDIELRIAELMSDAIKKGALCITEEIITTITSSIGNPNDLAEEAAASFEEEQKAANYDAAAEGEQPYKNWTRASNQSMLGGVCAGIAHRYQIDVTIVRLFCVLFLFTGIGFLCYLLLWIILPSEPIPAFTKKRLFRSPDNKRIGGVCAGLGFYFNMDAWIFRILFLVPFILSFFHWHSFFFWYEGTLRGSSVLVYLVMLAIIPKAKTAADKLEMKGQKVDLDAIKDVVNKDLKNIEDNAHKLGEKIKSTFNAKQNKEKINGLNNVINPILKLMQIIIAIGIFCFALLMVLVVLALFIKNHHSQSWIAYFLDFSSGENYLYIALASIVLLPFVGMLFWAIKIMSKSKKPFKWVSRVLFFVWIIALLVLIIEGSNYLQNFSTKAIVKKEFSIQNFKNNTLHIYTKSEEEFLNVGYKKPIAYSSAHMLSSDDLNKFTSNIKIETYPSLDTAWRAQILYCAKGPSQHMATQYVNELKVSINQLDSVLFINKYLYIPSYQKFRNQFCIVRIYMPVGKEIIFHKNLDQLHWYTLDLHDFSFEWQSGEAVNSRNEYIELEATYKMGYDGLDLVEQK